MSSGWLSWGTMTTGVAILVTSGVLYQRASNELDDYDSRFEEVCYPYGCTDDTVPELTNRLNDARTLETTSRVTAVIGIVTFTTGMAIVVSNWLTSDNSTGTLAAIVPGLSGDRATISVQTNF